MGVYRNDEQAREMSGDVRVRRLREEASERQRTNEICERVRKKLAQQAYSGMGIDPPNEPRAMITTRRAMERRGSSKGSVFLRVIIVICLWVVCCGVLPALGIPFGYFAGACLITFVATRPPFDLDP